MENSGEMLEETAGLVCIYKLFLPSLKMFVGSKYGKDPDSDNYCGCQLMSLAICLFEISIIPVSSIYNVRSNCICCSVSVKLHY